jgi:hypothetical protein
MFVRPTNPVSHRLARLAFITAGVAALVVASAGPLHRYVGLDVEADFAVFRYGFYLAVAAVALGLATIVPTRPGDRRRGFVAALLAIVIGAAAAYTPLDWFLRAQRSPEINDISTDIATPPALVVTLQLRRGAPNPPAYPGASAGVLQRAAYPDIVPLQLTVPARTAFDVALTLATKRKWLVVDQRPPAGGRQGVIEAVARSPIMGFRDDVVIRVSTLGQGSRVDLRSASRYGTHDFGANAARLRSLLEDIDDAAGSAPEPKPEPEKKPPAKKQPEKRQPDRR